VMNVRLAETVALEDQLRTALDAQQFVLHYQPKVELSTGQIAGAEALIRWQHPELGFLYPGRFISVIEESDLVIPMGEWVLRTACAQAKAWHDAGHASLTVSVNLSARQFLDDSLVHRVASALQTTGLSACFLEIELTENIVMTDPEQFIVKLDGLKRLGVKLSLDDFGTGYSSLSYLKRFPLDLLKIDQSFIRDVTTNPDDAAIVRAIISMGQSLALDLVAEGVETQAQLAWLQRERCDLMQGYHFSRPVTASEFEQMLRDRKCLPMRVAGDSANVKTLLIVDDETNIITSLVRLLHRDGYRILTAHSAEQAFELLALHHVHVIISDHRMPVMTGAEFLGKVKSMYPDTVRILLSGFVEIDALADAVNRGAVFRFLLKPWDDDILRESIRDGFHYYWLTHRELSEEAIVAGHSALS
jgi:EAL domain-containing protein (putative c-di-GMP-specific phosphodiesterase class I)/FixJ family two-component response regulator